MGETGVWRGLRFSGVGHYAEERLGISRTQAQLRVRLAREIRWRPLVREALDEGRLGREAASLVVRALRPARTSDAIEKAWIEHAAEITVKRLRDELQFIGRERALRPEVAVTQPVDDETWRASRARRPGQSIERIAMLGRAAQTYPEATETLRLSLSPELAAMMIGAVRFHCQRLESSCREERLEQRSEGAFSRASDAPGSLLAARMFSRRSGRVPEWVGLLALIEEFVATWDDPRQAPRRAGDRIYSRDGWRCSAPACTSRRNLEEHHIVYRSGGGSNKPSNLVTLCRFHHQHGEHGDLLRCRGRAPLGILWWMGRGGKGGFFRNERLTRGNPAWGILEPLFARQVSPETSNQTDRAAVSEGIE